MEAGVLLGTAAAGLHELVGHGAMELEAVIERCGLPGAAGLALERAQAAGQADEVGDRERGVEVEATRDHPRVGVEHGLEALPLGQLAPELDVILESVASVSEVAGPDVPMATHAMPMANVFRSDIVTASLTQEQALSGAPAQDDGRFRVPQILSED